MNSFQNLRLELAKRVCDYKVRSLGARPDRIEKLLSFVCAVATIPKGTLKPGDSQCAALISMAGVLLEELEIEEAARGAILDHVTNKVNERMERPRGPVT